MNKTDAFREIVDQIRYINPRIASSGAEIHGTNLMVMSQRAVLELLYEYGPQTIPQLAKRRAVSRQQILKLVTPLKADGYAEFHENPDHKRSFKIEITPKGRKHLETMIKREEKIYTYLTEHMKLSDLSVAQEVLNKIVQILERDDLKKAIKESL